MGEHHDAPTVTVGGLAGTGTSTLAMAQADHGKLPWSREELYHHFAKLYPGFVQRVPQYLLASFLGFTPEYLSEIRKRK